MAFNVNVSIFNNADIREALLALREVGGRRKLGIARWDNVLDKYPFSGTVVVPVKLQNRVFRDPFYFLIEKVNNHESLRVKPVKGDQWSIGDVYGFFGLHDFDDFVYGMPVLVVEGVSDWAVCKRYYKYVLASLTAWIGYRQAFFLSGLTPNIFIGFDNDETGATNRNNNKDLLKKFGANVGYIFPPGKDWGKAWESEFGREQLERLMPQFLDKINTINRYLVRM